MSQPDFREVAKLRYLLYEAIVELEFVQCVENCGSGLCASDKGRQIIKLGMELLGVKDLSHEHIEAGLRADPPEGKE